MIFFFRLDGEPALVQEKKCRGATTLRCSQGGLLNDRLEARRLRDAWWFEQNGNVESRWCLYELN